jgi:hypothetical protein
MEMEMKDDLSTTVDRLAAAASLLEQALDRLAERDTTAEASIGRIVATVEARRELELEDKLAATEAQLFASQNQLAELQARGLSAPASGRKTLPTAMTTLLAKQGVSAGALEAGSIQADSIDAALNGLSLEQRIAVKSQLLRAGLLS